VTGNGYKTVEAVDGAVEPSFTIGSRLGDFDALYGRIGDAPRGASVRTAATL